MFGFLKRDPVKKLEAEYHKLLEEARDLQRQGDIQGFAEKTAEAEALSSRIDALKQQSA
ncbi:MAG: DUF6435 family protein [Planctomycetota bacterium]|jgi:hypothetical protein